MKKRIALGLALALLADCWPVAGKPLPSRGNP